MNRRIPAYAFLLAGIVIGILIARILSFAEQRPDGAARSLVFVDRMNAALTVDGAPATVNAYVINGANYIRLRDFAAAVNVGVWWDADNNAVRIETSMAYDPDYTGP